VYHLDWEENTEDVELELWEDDWDDDIVDDDFSKQLRMELEKKGLKEGGTP
jgi:26 proteasome complex subunit DSS1